MDKRKIKFAVKWLGETLKEYRHIGFEYTFYPDVYSFGLYYFELQWWYE